MKKKVVLEMSLQEAAVVLGALVESQKGYTGGPSIPDRIFHIREVITNLDAAMEDSVKPK